MTQKELFRNVAAITGLTMADVEKSLKGLAREMRRALADSDKVVLPDIGTFTRVFRAARVTTGGFGKFDVPAHHQPKFKALKTLKEAVK